MRQPKSYQNGVIATDPSTDFKRAKDLLLRRGIYQQMGNFGPYYPNKESRHHKKVDRFTIDGMEFVIIESEVMSFSFDSLSVSKPYIQKEAWFQPTC
jgi:hypothetical protein